MPKNNKSNKNFELINNDNLEQSIKLVNHLTDLVERLRSDFIGTSKTNKSTIISDGLKQSEELRANIKDIIRQLKSLGIDTGFKLDIGLPTQGDIDNLLEYGDLLEEQNKQYKESIKLEAQRQAAIEAEKEKLAEKKKVLQEIDKLERKGKKDINAKREENKKLSLNNIGRRSKIDDDLNEAERNLANKTSELRTRAEKGDLSLNDLEDADILGDVGKDLKKGAEKFSIGSAAIQIGAETLKKGAEIFYDGVMAGLNNQVSAYNSSFSTIAAMTGTSRSQYKSAQNSLSGIGGLFGQGQLREAGMFDSIATSEVQQMWADLAENGANKDTMFADAIDSIVTRKIVPYLDTSSVAWQQMVAAQPSLMKNIRGINAINQDIAQNNYDTKDLLNQVLYDLQPMSDLATQDLAMSATGATTFINQAMASKEDGGLGLTKENAEQLWKDIYEQQYRGADVLEGGNLTQQLGYISNIIDPEANLYTSEGMVKGMKNQLDAYGYSANLGTGYDSTMSGLIQSKVNNSTGVSGSMAMQLYGTDYEGLSEKFYNKSIDALSKVEEYGEKETDNFAKGEYLTEEQQQTIYLENLATDLATLKEFLGKWWDIGKVLLEGIGAAVAGKLASNVIGKGIGKLAGSAVGGSGEGIVAAGGGLAVGAFTAAAAIVASGFIASGISEANAKNMGKNKDYYEATGELNKYQKTDAEGNTIEMSEGAKELLSSGIDNADSKGWGRNILEGFNWVGEYKSNPWMGWGVSREDRNKATFAKQMNLIDASNLSAEDTAKAKLAWLMIADASGVLGDLDDWTTDKIKQAFPTIYNDDGDAAWWIEKIQKWGNFRSPQISTDAGKTETYKIPTAFDKYHRLGLSSVPYDNYPALLHQDEAVLTASTANELRNLVVEYRDTKNTEAQLEVTKNNQDTTLDSLATTYQDTLQQQANIEAAIQSQTTSLCTKLDEVIHAIQISNNMQVAPVSDDPVSNNMRYIRSTKSFI